MAEAFWEPDVSGWVAKKGDVVKLWRPRYLCLKNGRLYWFSNSELLPSTEPRGCYSVWRFCAIRLTPEPKQQFAFELVPRHGPSVVPVPPLKIAPQSSAEARRWIDELSRIIAVFEQELTVAKQLFGLRCCALEAPLFGAIRRAIPVKSCHLVKDGRGRDCVMTVLAPPLGSPLPVMEGSEASRQLLRKLFLDGLVHPFLWPTLVCEFHVGQGRVASLRPFAPQGSLRDFMRGGDAQNEYMDKYRRSGKPLAPQEVKRFGRQILEGLSYLQIRGLSGVHVHCGNILVDRGDAFISSEVVENELFALPVPAELATHHPEATALGRLLYEMACGAPPPLSGPNLPSVKPEGLQPIIRSLLVHAPGVVPPKARDRRTTQQASALCREPMFAEVNLLVDVRYACGRLLEPEELATLRAAGAGPLSVEPPSTTSLLPGLALPPHSADPTMPSGGDESPVVSRRTKAAHSHGEHDGGGGTSEGGESALRQLQLEQKRERREAREQRRSERKNNSSSSRGDAGANIPSGSPAASSASGADHGGDSTPTAAAEYNGAWWRTEATPARQPLAEPGTASPAPAAPSSSRAASLGRGAEDEEDDTAAASSAGERGGADGGEEAGGGGSSRGLASVEDPRQQPGTTSSESSGRQRQKTRGVPAVPGGAGGVEDEFMKVMARRQKRRAAAVAAGGAAAEGQGGDGAAADCSAREERGGSTTTAPAAGREEAARGGDDADLWDE